MERGTAKQLLDTLLEDLYRVPFKVVYTNIAEMVVDNIELTLNIVNDDLIRFVRFNGKIYFSTYLPVYKDRQTIIYNRDTGTKSRRMELHSTIATQLEPEILELVQLEKDQNDCAYYLRNVLNKCRTLYDVRALLPGAIWALLKIKLPDVSVLLSFPTADKDEFIAAHTEDIVTIKERLFLNLLLKKV